MIADAVIEANQGEQFEAAAEEEKAEEVKEEPAVTEAEVQA